MQFSRNISERLIVPRRPSWLGKKQSIWFQTDENKKLTKDFLVLLELPERSENTVSPEKGTCQE